MNHADVILPIVHLNGDRKSTLIANLEHAYDATAAALKALSQAYPNARNYYPVDGLYPRAEAQHRQRMLHVQAVLDSLIAEVEGIDRAYPGAR